jgi:hypothetical protein
MLAAFTVLSEGSAELVRASVGSGLLQPEASKDEGHHVLWHGERMGLRGGGH